MLYENSNYFTKDNLDTYLKVLAKEFRKLNGTTMPAVKDLYGSWDEFPSDSKLFIENAIDNGNYEEIYLSISKE